MKLCTTCWLTFKRCVEHPPRRKRRGFLRPLGLFFRDGFGGFLPQPPYFSGGPRRGFTFGLPAHRSEEHTSELQSLTNLVCRLLLEKKKKKQRPYQYHTIC